MAAPFQSAWNLLKYFRNPDDEEKSFGNESYRNHPLHGQENYEGGMPPQGENAIPEEMMEEMGRRHAIMPDAEYDYENDFQNIEPNQPNPMEMKPHMEPPNSFEGERGSMHPEEGDYDDQPPASSQDESERPPHPRQDMPANVGVSRGPPRTSKRGEGHEQAFDAPQRPDWWRGE